MSKRGVRKCSDCGQPVRPGRHHPGEYEHAQGCRYGKKQRTYTESEAREMVAKAVERCQDYVRMNGDDNAWDQQLMGQFFVWAADIRSGKEPL
jgi:hypothetical protein